MPVRPTKQQWLAARRDYEMGKGSIREVAQRHNLNYFTVRNRCTQERWNANRTELEERLEKKVEAKLERKAEEITDQAKELLTRTVMQSFGWLDSIAEMKAKLDAEDYDGLKKLVDSWAAVIKTGRTALGLSDEPAPVRTSLVQVLVQSSPTSTPLRIIQRPSTDEPPAPELPPAA